MCPARRSPSMHVSSAGARRRAHRAPSAPAPTGPMRRPARRRRRGRGLDRQLRVAVGRREVAGDQGHARPVELDCGGDAGQLAVVDRDDPAAGSFRVVRPASGRGWRAAALDRRSRGSTSANSLLDISAPTNPIASTGLAGRPRRGCRRATGGAWPPAGPAATRGGRLDEVRRPVHLARSERVTHGGNGLSRLVVPVAGAQVDSPSTSGCSWRRWDWRTSANRW